MSETVIIKKKYGVLLSHKVVQQLPYLQVHDNVSPSRRLPLLSAAATAEKARERISAAEKGFERVAASAKAALLLQGLLASPVIS